MRIGIYLKNLSGRGGTQREMSLLANGLSKSRFDDKVFLIEEKHNSLSTAFPLVPQVKVLSLFHETDSTQDSQVVRVSLENLLIALKIDVLVISCWEQSFLPIIACKNVSVPSIVWDLGCPLPEHEYDSFSDAKVMTVLLAEKFSDIIVITPTQKKIWDDWLSKRGYKKTVTLIPNMIEEARSDHNIMQNEEFCNNVLSAGRLVPSKGFHVLIDIWQNLFPSSSLSYPWKLLIVGDEEPGIHNYKALLEEKVCGRDDIKLLPGCSDLASIYSEVSIFALAASGESFGLVLAEAQSYGIPVVAYSCPMGGQKMIIKNGESGFLIQKGNQVSFGRALERLIKDPKLRKDFSQVAKKQGEQFYPENIMPLWLKLFQKFM